MKELKASIFHNETEKFCRELRIKRSSKASFVDEINKPDEFGYTLFHYAAQHGNVTIMQALFDAGALVNVEDMEGRTPLHLAAVSPVCNAITLRFLLLCGANITSQDKEGNTPLVGLINRMSANTTNLTQDVFRKIFLLKQQSTALVLPPDVKQIIMIKASEIALMENNLEAFHPFLGHLPHQTGHFPQVYKDVIAILDKEKVAIPAEGWLWRKLVDKAIAAHDQKTLMTLISMPGVKVDAVDSKGATLLHRVVDEVFVDAATLLLDKGADISLQDKEGSYPLTPRSPRVLRDVFAKSTDALRKDLQARRDTTAVMPPLSESEHTLYTPLQAIAEHTLCLNAEDKDKMNKIYSTMLSYNDYPTTLVMAGIALTALDGMDIFVAHGNDVFTIDAFPNCQDMAGFYANSHNIIALSNIDKPLYAARVFFHEGLHALLYKMDKKMAHNGKPYPHGDKVLKQEYVDSIEASKHIPVKTSPEPIATPHSFVKSTLIKDVEGSYLYSKHSSKLKEYIVRAGEVHLYGVQLPGYKQGAEEAAGPLLSKAFRQDFVKMLEQHVISHPRFHQLNLPYHMQIKLESAKAKSLSSGVLAV